MGSDFARFRTAVLTVAKDSLDRLGALSAFAVVLRSDSDTVSFIEAEEVSDESQKDVDALQSWLRQQVKTGAYRAVAVCAPCEVTLQDGQGAVRALFASLEHCSGEAVDVFVPFEKHDTYEYQEEIVVERAPTIFTAPDTPPRAGRLS